MKTFHPHPEARGVGLFMTRNQVEAMGGKISVESEEGHGSTFIIHLPKGIE
jgi:signal transduction histidine kinase